MRTKLWSRRITQRNSESITSEGSLNGKLPFEKVAEEFKENAEVFGLIENMDEVVSELDKNKNGLVEFDEFMEEHMKMMELSFNKFDVDKSGFIE